MLIFYNSKSSKKIARREAGGLLSEKNQSIKDRKQTNARHLKKKKYLGFAIKSFFLYRATQKKIRI
jgi:hypothetical protein